jgi:hypothetical protein
LKFKVSLANLGVSAVVNNNSNSPSSKYNTELSRVKPSASDNNVARDVKIRDAKSYEA